MANDEFFDGQKDSPDIVDAEIVEETPQSQNLGDADQRTAENLALLASEMASLRDLFNRRLLEDKSKNAMFDEMYSQLEFARDGLRKQTVLPIVSQLILLIDRLEQVSDRDDLTESIRTELIGVLAGQGVVAIATDSPRFDPASQEAIGTVSTDEVDGNIAPGEIAQVFRTGYRDGDRILRPTQVVVAR